MRLVIVFLPLLFLVECNAYAFVGAPYYIQTGSCEVDNVCEYTYEAALIHSVDTQKQNVTISATVEVACDSTGEYAYYNATKYCLSVTESIVEHEGISGKEDTELDEKLSGWFCFVQMENGKIPIVMHSRNESLNIVNFKKAIVAGFQANFEGTVEQEETDPESVHVSHYRYINWPRHHHRSGHMHRHFNQYDVEISATQFPEPVEYSKDEELEYKDERLSHAHGTAHFVIPRRPSGAHPYSPSGGDNTQESLLDRDPRYRARPKRRAPWRGPGRYRPPTQTYDPRRGFNRFFVYSTYTLDLVQCSSDMDAVARRRRDIEDSMREGYFSSSLAAAIDHDQKFQELEQLNVDSTLEYIFQHPQDSEKVKELKRFLVQEDKSVSSSSVSEAAEFLQNIIDASDPDYIALRLKMYAMLAPLTNSRAQQVLLACVEHVSNATEWDTLLLNIALLVNPNHEFVTKLQTLVTAKTVRDSNSLLLVYGALASRAAPDLQIDMITYLNTRLQDSTGSNADLIHLIHSLGNAGSTEIIDILLEYINHDAIDVQVAVITAMRKQTNNARVLAAFLEILKAPNPDVRIVSALANTLIKGVESCGVDNKQATLAVVNALVSSSKPLDNAYINELLSYYLSQLRRHDVRVGSRLRRDVGNWMSSGPEYNMIASYETRQEDGIQYPRHKAYLWSKQIGVKDFNLQVAAGMFTGAGDRGGEHKIFGKAAAKVNAFGESATAMEVEVLRNQDFYGEVYKVVYITVGGYVLLDFEAFSDEEEVPTSYGKDTEYQILEFDWEVFMTAASITTQITVYAKIDSYFEIEADISSREGSYIAEGLLSPTLTVRAEGSSTFDVLGTQGEITLEGVIGYEFEAEGYISGCTNGESAPVVCTTIADQWPRAYVNLSTWYKTDKSTPCGFEKCTVRGHKDLDSLPNERWALDARYSELLWGDCDELEDTPMCVSDIDYPKQPEIPVTDDPYDDTDQTFPPVTDRPSWPTDDTEPLTRPFPEFPTKGDPEEYPDQPDEYPDRPDEFPDRPDEYPDEFYEYPDEFDEFPDQTKKYPDQSKYPEQPKSPEEKQYGSRP